MTSSQPSIVGDALARWVGFVTRRRWPVLLLALLVTVASLAFAAVTLTINTSTTDMLSEELPFRRNHEALKAAFPALTANLLLVVQGENENAVEAERRSAWPPGSRCGQDPLQDGVLSGGRSLLSAQRAALSRDR